MKPLTYWYGIYLRLQEAKEIRKKNGLYPAVSVFGSIICRKLIGA